MNQSSLLVRLFAAGDTGNVDEFNHYLDDDVIVHAPAGLSTVGLDRERESWLRARAAIPDLNHRFIDVFTTPTAEAARCVVTGTLRGTYGGFSADDRSFTLEQAVFAHVRNGKITELWEIIDTGQLREQFGDK